MPATSAVAEVSQGAHPNAITTALCDPKNRIVDREQLAPGRWTRELVVHRLKHEGERTMIADAGITVWNLSDVHQIAAWHTPADELSCL